MPEGLEAEVYVTQSHALKYYINSLLPFPTPLLKKENAPFKVEFENDGLGPDP